MNIIFVDDSKGHMEQLFCEPQSNGKPLFIELLEKNMTPITIFFGNFENEYKMFKPIGMQELAQFLDNYAKYLSYNGYEYDKKQPSECIYKKKIDNNDISVDVNKSAFLLYEDDNPISQRILQGWDDDINDKPKENAKNYYSDEINKFLEDLNKKISNNKGDIVLIDMMLIIDDQERLVNKQKIRKPILSMMIYHYLQTKSVRCAVYSTYAKRKVYQEKWIEKYNEFFADHRIEKEDFIIDRQQLNAKIINEI